MDTDKKQTLKSLESSVEHEEVDARFTSPIGDVGLKFLDQEFARIAKWIEVKLEDSWYKDFVLARLQDAYKVVRALVAKALD